MGADDQIEMNKKDGSRVGVRDRWSDQVVVIGDQWLRGVRGNTTPVTRTDNVRPDNKLNPVSKQEILGTERRSRSRGGSGERGVIEMRVGGHLGENNKSFGGGCVCGGGG